MKDRSKISKSEKWSIFGHTYWNLKFDCFDNLFPLLQDQEEGTDKNKTTFKIEETAEPTPTAGERILASLKSLKAYLADLFVNFVILPNSKLTLIKYINCLFVFATTLTITYMVS